MYSINIDIASHSKATVYWVNVSLCSISTQKIRICPLSNAGYKGIVSECEEEYTTVLRITAGIPGYYRGFDRYKGIVSECEEEYMTVLLEQSNRKKNSSLSCIIPRKIGHEHRCDKCFDVTFVVQDHTRTLALRARNIAIPIPIDTVD